jgi:transcriptional regulator with XRE-family HTH domain
MEPPLPISQAVAEEIRAELGRQRKSARDLATATGINYRTLSYRLAGHTRFTLEELLLITIALNMSMPDLVRDAA